MAQHWLVIAVFAGTYVLIAARRLAWLPIGRPAGALLGAVAMVAIGALTPEESYAAVDHGTLVLLFGMMLLTAYLEDDGFIEGLARTMLRLCHGPRTLLFAVSGLSALLSALLVNDTVCLFLPPVVIATCLAARLPLAPYLMAIATSANLGSAATLVGNPQNMIIGSMSRMPFDRFLLWCGPAALVTTVLNTLLLAWWYRRELAAVDAGRLELEPAQGATSRPSGPRRDPRFAGLVVAGMVVGFLAGWPTGYTALAAALAFMVRARTDARTTFARIDWPLLVFFVGLFVVVKGLDRTGLVESAWKAASPLFRTDTVPGLAALVGFLVVGSNLVSNVPMVLLAGPYLTTLGFGEEGWVLLAFVTTAAGNLTLLGSVANILVAEQARDHYDLSYREYLGFGVTSTLAMLAIGVPLILMFRP